MARRTNGEGCVVRTADGKWSARIQIGIQPNGKPKIKTFSGKTRKEAAERLNDYIIQLERMHGSKQNKITVCEGLLFWLETYKKIYLKPTSYDRLESTIQSNIIPYIGHIRVSELTASVIQGRLINALYEKGLSYSTIKKAYNAMNAYLRQCVCDDIISKNPMMGVRLPSQTKFKNEEIIALTSNERQRFFDAAIQTFKSTNGLITRNGYAYIMVLYTGLRLSEALSLKWKDVDVENKYLHIYGNVVFVRNRDKKANTAYKVLEQKSTKTASGMRDVPLCEKALTAILRHKELYSPKENDYVFTSRNGKLVTPRNFAKALNGIYQRANIEASGAHILRHTFASMLFEKGIDIKIISKVLGHSRVEITYNIYVHLIKSQEAAAVGLLDEFDI